MTTTTAAGITVEQAERIGGRRWAKNGHDRVYFGDDVWTALLGLDIDRYKTGNISGATLDGERISNAEAGRILTALNKVWLDVPTGRLFFQAGTGRYADTVPDQVCKAIRDRIAATEPAPVADVEPHQVVAALRAGGRTVRQIAAAVGCSVSTVYRWAHGVCRPCPRYAAALIAVA